VLSDHPRGKPELAGDLDPTKPQGSSLDDIDGDDGPSSGRRHLGANPRIRIAPSRIALAQGVFGRRKPLFDELVVRGDTEKPPQLRFGKHLIPSKDDLRDPNNWDQLKDEGHRVADGPCIHAYESEATSLVETLNGPPYQRRRDRLPEWLGQKFLEAGDVRSGGGKKLEGDHRRRAPFRIGN
jgi:hypothetical protein